MPVRVLAASCIAGFLCLISPLLTPSHCPAARVPRPTLRSHPIPLASSSSPSPPSSPPPPPRRPLGAFLAVGTSIPAAGARPGSRGWGMRAEGGAFDDEQGIHLAGRILLLEVLVGQGHEKQDGDGPGGGLPGLAGGAQILLGQDEGRAPWTVPWTLDQGGDERAGLGMPAPGVHAAVGVCGVAKANQGPAGALLLQHTLDTHPPPSSRRQPALPPNPHCSQPSLSQAHSLTLTDTPHLTVRHAGAGMQLALAAESRLPGRVTALCPYTHPASGPPASDDTAPASAGPSGDLPASPQPPPVSRLLAGVGRRLVAYSLQPAAGEGSSARAAAAAAAAAGAAYRLRRVHWLPTLRPVLSLDVSPGGLIAAGDATEGTTLYRYLVPPHPGAEQPGGEAAAAAAQPGGGAWEVIRRAARQRRGGAGARLSPRGEEGEGLLALAADAEQRAVFGALALDSPGGEPSSSSSSSSAGKGSGLVEASGEGVLARWPQVVSVDAAGGWRCIQWDSGMLHFVGFVRRS